MEIEINAPWGSSKLDVDKPLSIIKYGLKQLEYYRDFNFNKTQSLREDIKGYEKLIGSEDPALNAVKFLKEKKLIKKMFPNKKISNIEIIEGLIIKNLWDN